MLVVVVVLVMLVLLSLVRFVLLLVVAFVVAVSNVAYCASRMDWRKEECAGGRAKAAEFVAAAAAAAMVPCFAARKPMPKTSRLMLVIMMIYSRQLLQSMLRTMIG
jgi:hypothetical protein